MNEEIGSKFIAPFQMAEIEINSHCNRRCSYCPQSVPGYRKPPRFMTLEAFQKIMLILRDAEFKGRISYHFFNEPLLHPQIYEIVSSAATICPEAHQVIFTNGDLLTEECYLKLIECGASKIVVTSHGGKVFPERERQVNLTPQDLHLTNRGGKVLEKIAILSTPCFAPSTMLIVGVNGNVMLCYEDADRTTTFGNLFETSLEQIWFSPSAVEVRRRLESGDRDVRKVCSECSNITHESPIVYDLHP